MIASINVAARMPSNVARFEQLMYLSLALGVLGSALEWNQLVSLAAPVGGATLVLFIQGAVLANGVLLIWLIARRRKNWARWLLLIGFVIGIPSYAEPFTGLVGSNALAAVLSTVEGLAQIIALCFIFSGNAREWFAHPATDRIPR